MFGLKLPKQDVVYAVVMTRLWRGYPHVLNGDVERGNDDDDSGSDGTRARGLFGPGRGRS